MRNSAATSCSRRRRALWPIVTTRRLLALRCQAVAAIAAGVQALAVAVAAGQTNLYLLGASAADIGAAQALASPAQRSLPRFLVSAEDLPSALALSSASLNLARVIRPAVGAVAVVTGGYAFAFAINALSFLVLTMSLMRLRLVIEPPRNRNATFRAGVRAVATVPGALPVLVAVAPVSAAIEPSRL